LVVNVVGLFTFTGVALCVFGYVALTLWMTIRSGRDAETSNAAEIGAALMALSWIVALVGGAAVGAFHWVAWSHAAYAVLGLYASAVLVWLFGRALNGLWSFALPAVGVALHIAVMQLGSPPGADDMEQAENWTPIAVAVLDESGDPVEGATVTFDLVQFWHGDPELEGDREWWTKSETDAQGIAKTSLREDPRFKRLVIRVRHEASSGYPEPKTIAACVGHEPARHAASLPAPKVPYVFEVKLKPRPHPDTAFLAVELDAPDAQPGDISRSLTLILTTEGDLRRNDEHRTTDEIAEVDEGIVQNIYLSQREKVVFKLNRDLAGRPLKLHVLERNPGHDGSYTELAAANTGFIAAGTSRKLHRIMVPPAGNVTASRSLPGVR
jgi:hypothetical protein